MRKKELIDATSAKCKTSKKSFRKIGFGTDQVYSRVAKNVRILRTGRKVCILASKHAVLSCGKALGNRFKAERASKHPVIDAEGAGGQRKR